MKRITFLLILFLIFSIGCQKNEPNNSPPSPMLIHSLSSSSDSCVALIKDQPHNNPNIIVRQCTLYVDLVDTFNCCTDSIGIQLRVPGEFNLKIYFTGFVSTPCFCICPFDMRAVVTVGESGHYFLQIYNTEWMSGTWSAETSLAWQDTIAIASCQ